MGKLRQRLNLGLGVALAWAISAPAATARTFVVTSLNDAISLGASEANPGGADGSMTLREALLFASDGDSIVFDAALNGAISVDVAGLGALGTDQSITIDSGGRVSLTANGLNAALIDTFNTPSIGGTAMSVSGATAPTFTIASSGAQTVSTNGEWRTANAPVLSAVGSGPTVAIDVTGQNVVIENSSSITGTLVGINSSAQGLAVLNAPGSTIASVGFGGTAATPLVTNAATLLINRGDIVGPSAGFDDRSAVSTNRSLTILNEGGELNAANGVIMTPPSSSDARTLTIVGGEIRARRTGITNTDPSSPLGADTNVVINNSANIFAGSSGAGYGIELSCLQCVAGVANQGAITARDAGIRIFSGTNVSLGALGGPITLQNSGAINVSNGAAISVFGTRLTQITNSAALTASGDGISLSGAGTLGDSVVTNSGRIIAGANGIFASASRGLVVTNTGDVTAGTGTGLHANSFRSFASPGSDIHVTNTALVSSSAGDGMRTVGGIVVYVTNSGTIRGGGAGAGLRIDQASDSAVVINTGTIEAASGPAIFEQFRNVQLTNSGLIRSGGAVTVNLGGGADTLTWLQGGRFSLASDAPGYVDGGDAFDRLIVGPGSFTLDDRFVNFESVELVGADLTFGRVTELTTGTLSINAASRLRVPTTARIIGAVNNLGVIALDNGAANNLLTIDGVLTSPGAVRLDLNLTPGSVGSDRLQLGGVAGAPVALTMVDITSGSPAAGVSTPVATVGGSVGASSVVLAAPVRSGAYVLNLLGDTFYLESLVNPRIQTYATALATLPNVWGAGLAPVSAMMRDGASRDRDWRAWASSITAASDFLDDDATFAPSEYDVSGGAWGLDRAFGSDRSLVVGAFANVVDASSDVQDSGGFDAELPAVGAYASWAQGGWGLGFIAMAERGDLDFSDEQNVPLAETEAWSMGAQADVRRAIGGVLGWQVTPWLRARYVVSDFGVVSDRYGATIAAESFDRLEGLAGAELSQRFALGDGVSLRAFVDAAGGFASGQATVVSNGVTAAPDTEGAIAQGQAGLELTFAERFSAGIRLEARQGAGDQAFGGGVSLSYAF